MHYRPGRESDFTHLQTFVWQAIYPAFDVPGLSDAQRAENDHTVEGAHTRVLAALNDPAAAVITAWDDRRRVLAGYIVGRRRGRDAGIVEEIYVRRADWGLGVGEALLRELAADLGTHRELLVALRPYNGRGIGFFGKQGFTETGEAGGDLYPDRMVYLRPGDGSVAAEPPVVVPPDEEDDFPTEADEPHFEPVYEALPDHRLAQEELSTELTFDPETSSLDEQKLNELEAFIARARAKKAGQEPPPPPAPKATEATRHANITFEVDFGDAEPEPEPEEAEEDNEPDAPPLDPLSFEFVFDRDDTAPAPRRPEPAPEPEEEALELQDIPDPAPEITLPQLRSAFEDRLGDRLTAYFGADALPRYLKVYGSAENFHRIRDAGLQGLLRYLNAGPPPAAAAARRRGSVIADLIEYFIVETAATVHEKYFPQRLLRYQGVDWTRVDLFRLVMDYLDFDDVDDIVYTDFVSTPPKVLKNAAANFLHATRDERVLFICDQSLFGNGKTGFALTDAALYWKNVLQPAGVVTYTTVRTVEVAPGHLQLDGQYFDAGRRLNLRVALLLDKLRRMELPQ